MFKIYNIHRCHMYISSIFLDFQRSIAVSQCRNYYAPKKSCRNVVMMMPSNNYNCKGIWRWLKTWPASFSEVSEVMETNENDKKEPIDPSKDRTKVIPPETSIRYMKSEAYKTTYGDENVWVKYRRNFKGQFVPRKTRKTCVISGVIDTGNPCPICRDEYLVLHYTNVDLLKQFIHPETGEIYSTRKTHICQKKLLQLEVAIKKAKFYGYITDEVPFRKYDYKEYYPQYQE